VADDRNRLRVEHGGLVVALRSWTTVDVRSDLPVDWVAQILAVAAHAPTTTLLLAAPTGTEPSGWVVVHSVDGGEVGRRLPWLTDLYEDVFRRRVERCAGDRVSPAADPRRALSLDVQTGGNRYQPNEGDRHWGALLHVTDHPEGTGGELVLGHDPQARTIEEIDAACSVIHPEAGHLLLFDARRHPHYVRPLRTPGRSRIAVTMSYPGVDAGVANRTRLAHRSATLDSRLVG
jgi:hypothetical protein